jgi:intracellular sulfur oxidation DsrE/DsrF family protein
MKERERMSPEILNAFVDGELAPVDVREIRERLHSEPEVASEACDISLLKEMVRTAYEDLPAPQSRQTRGRPRFSRAVAAVLVAGLSGVVLGWLSHDLVPAGPQMLSGARIAPELGAAHVDLRGIVLHVATPDAVRLEDALNDLERLVGAGSGEAERVKVELVVNGEGLDLIRAGSTPLARRLQALMQRHQNVAVLACRNALQRLKLLRGDEPTLLPGVLLAPSGLDQILKRLQEGWAYVRV